ncbi:MAG: VrlD [Candidatus Thioglobus sp.]|nr:VrlD [Candidatus Thioglobus sp.]
MIVKRRGGMTEFIPSPQEKREGLVRDHSFNLIENLHHRLSRLEEELGLPLEEAEACTAFLDKMKQDESRNTVIHTNLITGGPRSGFNNVASPPDS